MITLHANVAAADMRNWLLRDGELFDGSGGAGRAADVRIRDGVIAEIAPGLEAAADEESVDATGLIVVPGLVDLHTHVFAGMGDFAVDPADAGLGKGVTTLIDTGTAGALTYATFERFVMPAAAEDVYAFLSISRLGIIQNHTVPPGVGELSDLRFVDVPAAVACIERFPDRLVGVKVRLTRGLAADTPAHEQAAFRAALEVAAQTGLPLMVHHIDSALPYAEVIDALRPGDIYTHMFHVQPDNPFTLHGGAPPPELLAARERGVIFDLGHGSGSFAWEVAAPACRQHGFWPDTISTDIHQLNLDGPVYDMATTMAKLLHLGMPLPTLLGAVTSAPAAAAGIADRCGRIAVGRAADITLLQLERGKFALADCRGERRTARERLRPVTVFKDGVRTLLSN